MKKIDRPLLITVATLIVVGFFIFTSASLGLLAREGAHFSSVALSQIVFGIGLGTVALLITSTIHYRFWRKYAIYFFLFSIAATLLVFVPGLGFSYGGATRWVDLGIITFQPAELLKIGFVIYLATWLSGIRDKLHTFAYGVVPLFVLIGIVGGLLLTQPDTGTLLVILVTAIAMFIAAGARWREIAIFGGMATLGVAVLAYTRPYIMDRILTFFNPASDPLGASYQIQQSLIAVGSGEWFGRGFGQSVQKFQYLPEPIGDSIFAVAAEEFGFIGSMLLVGLFLFFAFRGLTVAAHAPDYFGGLLALGIVILIVSQSFINMASMLGVLPLTGLPLVFVSHGGTALLLALASVGILLNISKFKRS
jgi:cell division protein FtsW|tara:strand:+ start:71645 stop:72736 length:1092 start_codon:yes stop_codon:yes gene_type:complete